MKRFKNLLLLTGLSVCVLMKAQVPIISNTAYSTKKGTITDSRDGKVYAYKQYGDYQWFTQNLAYEGSVMNGTIEIKGVFLPGDADGKIYGMVYPSHTNNTNATMNKLCPEGWTAATKGDYENLFKAAISEYGLTDVGTSNYAGLAKYLRGGGVAGTDPNGLWVAGTEIDPKAAEIGFNALPSGVYNISTSGFGSGDALGTKASFLTGTWYHYYMVNNNNELKYGNRNSVHHGAIRCLRLNIAFPDIEIKTPYSTTFELDLINGADKEKTRLRQNHKKSDHIVTGFYALKTEGNIIEVNVETLQPSTGGIMPSIVIGTPGHIGNSTKEIALKEGINTINSTQHSGGLIYFRYATNGSDTPQGKVKISFTTNSQQVRAPHFVFGTTTDEEFASMLGKYQTDDVIFTSPRVIVIATRTNAVKYSRLENKTKWMDGLHRILDQEEMISGMDNADPNPLHHIHKPFEVRHMMIETTSLSPHASPVGYTAYPASSINRYLTYSGTIGAPWMIAHEVGHQHQQGAYMIDKATESTVNIYSYVVNRYTNMMAGATEYNRTSAQRWQQIQDTYLKLPIEQRIYNMDDGELEKITGFNRDEARFMVWEQLFIMFGDEFYKTLHRVVREENALGGTNEERKLYLIQKSSQITGYDLRGFFNEWGIRIDDDYLLTQINKVFDEAIKNGTIIAMPEADNVLSHITGQNRPSWAPLPLKGISTSTPPAATVDSQPEDQLASKLKYTDYSTSKGVFEDPRDGKKYRYKKYGQNDWFTENLNYVDERPNTTTPLPASIAPANDADGKIYGRMYITYAGKETYEGWCPAGWRAANKADWANLQNSIKEEYGLSNKQVASAMMAGGDRDNVEDGLWAKGSLGYFTDDKTRVAVGFNALPAGVYTSAGFEGGDEQGKKASFFEPTEEWYHYVLDAKGMYINVPNRNSRHYASIRCVREASNMIDQAITFEPIEAKSIDDADFAPAIASSNLPITYTSSDETVATVVNGMIHIMGQGTATITASQNGNESYNAAKSVTQTLTVLNNDTSIQKVYINGKEHNMGQAYDMKCDEGNSVSIAIESAEGAVLDIESEFDVVIDKPMTKNIEFTVTSEDGKQTKKYTLSITKRTDFFDIAEVCNNNILKALLSPNKNGGHLFIGFKWYKNDKLVSLLPVYNPSIGKINPNDEFYLEALTIKGERIRTCVYKSDIPQIEAIVYPNPAHRGETVNVEIKAGDNLLKSSSIQVFSIYGFYLGQTKVKGSITPIRMPYLPGTYILRIKNIDGYVQDLKVIVK